MSPPLPPPVSPALALCAAERAHDTVASDLARRLGLPLLQDCAQTGGVEFLLVVAPHPHCGYRLQLQFPGTRLAPVCVDFQSDQLKHRQQFGGGRRQPIARAMGLKKGANPMVLDATAGLGRDAFILSALGCEVHMIERHPIIHALLEDGLRRLAAADTTDTTASSPAKRLHLHQADSAQWLTNRTQPVDIVYLDPMYPHRTKSALVKKEMRILRSLVGDDSDVPALLETALTVARKRVVVKRPKTAPRISETIPSHCIESRKTRYDVYLPAVNTPAPAPRTT